MDTADFGILIVDDEEDLLELVVDSFDLEGFTVFGATDGHQAYEVLGENQVHVIICDENLPGEFNGKDILKHLQENNKLENVKFYMATGDLGADEKSLKESGATGLIEKPFDTDELVARVKKDLGI